MLNNARQDENDLKIIILQFCLVQNSAVVQTLNNALNKHIFK